MSYEIKVKQYCFMSRNIFSFLSYLILLAVSLDRSCVRQDQMVGNDVGLGCWIPGCAVSKRLGAPSGGRHPVIIPESSHNSGLIGCDPVLHSVSKCLKTKICIFCKIFSAESGAKFLNNQSHWCPIICNMDSKCWKTFDILKSVVS